MTVTTHRTSAGHTVRVCRVPGSRLLTVTVEALERGTRSPAGLRRYVLPPLDALDDTARTALSPNESLERHPTTHTDGRTDTRRLRLTYTVRIS